MFERPRIRHCKQCGTAVTYRLPDDGDTRERAICPACHTVHYENPLNVVGTIPIWNDQVLLCKRNIEPRLGKWTLPAGFMELGETVMQGAARETQEEAGAQFQMLELFTLMNVVRVGQVHFFFRAQLTSPDFDPGHETQEARLFAEQDIPWDDIAFRTVRETLRCYFADRARGHYSLHQIDIA
jgi:ADP-ribose pyrophosphatase YjhB (NUDIX family)